MTRDENPPYEFLSRAGLSESPRQSVWTRLGGGVSSDVWRVDFDDRTICVKRAIPRLRVAAEWLAPVERCRYEWEWLRFADRVLPGFVPKPLAHVREMLMTAIEYLPENEFRLWKSDLLTGVALPEFASAVGLATAKFHSAAFADESLRAVFDDNAHFVALRVDAYLNETARLHSDLKSAIEKIAGQTANARTTLIHGDVSPKNIFIGPRNPVFVDAETATLGDPAFDIAFCLNHLLLKKVFRPASATSYRSCFEAMAESYLASVDWESRYEVENRAARLLAVLFLARVDGKSPVEYITEDRRKDEIRRTARRWIAEEVDELSEIARFFELTQITR